MVGRVRLRPFYELSLSVSHSNVRIILHTTLVFEEAEEETVRHHVDHVQSGNHRRIRLHQAAVCVVHTRIEQHQQAEPRVRPAVKDVADDRQREVTEFLRRGIIPQQRQRQEEKDEEVRGEDH